LRLARLQVLWLRVHGAGRLLMPLPLALLPA
jgi:hypothetical protein